MFGDAQHEDLMSEEKDEIHRLHHGVSGFSWA
jgi:hypothetical protein